MTRSKFFERYTLAVAVAATILFGLITLPPSSNDVEAQSRLGPVQCTSNVAITGATAATVELVALGAGKRVYVCGFTLTGGGATAVTFKYGTGTTCGTGTASLTGAMELGDNTSISYGNGVGAVMRTPVSQALCWTNSGAVQVSGVLTYAQY